MFEGGFLGLDNIGVFNRSEDLPTGGVLEQADSTGWMAFYSLNMLNIALELAKHRRTYEDIASKFFEHFLFISDAMTYRDGGKESSLWNDEDGCVPSPPHLSLFLIPPEAPLLTRFKQRFYYDAISHGGPTSQQMPVRSLVGLIPMFAVLTLEPEVLKNFPSFTKRLDWFIDNRTDVAERNIASMKRRGKGDRLMLALVSQEKLKLILKRMLDEDEFFSAHGIRSLSKYHDKNPYSMNVGGAEFKVDYVPGDSNSALFGGNSNWRGVCSSLVLHLVYIPPSTYANSSLHRVACLALRQFSSDRIAAAVPHVLRKQVQD